jgi:class 3 adenylate cyclase
MGRYEDLISASLGITGILFAQHFLQLKQNAPFMNRLFQVLLLLFSAGIVLVLFRQFMLATVFIELVSLVLILIFFAAAFRVLRKGYKPARFFLFAWSALLIGVIVFVLKDFNIIPYSALSVHSLKIGSAVEALLLSMALANRINTYKREKEEAQLQTLASLKENDRLIRTQNIMLETKVEERTRELSEEKKKSDDLLLNILPAETAEELKRTGKARAKSFESVSVLFTDFKNFTQASESMSPEALVQEINECYSAFDDIVARHKLEKIKTIGDAYMCAGGLPVANTSNAADCVRAALEMQHFMKARSRGRADGWQLRVGIHTGPVVAGIVGIRKFAYDIWGDTVNIAARMESSGEPGKVNISGSTYTHVRDLFYCIHRGKVKAKNKGEIDMYFVEAHAPESSAV